MHRTATRRFAAALFAVWFALVAADVPGLHTCAMHDVPTTGASATAAHADHAGHAEHAGHAGHQAPAAAPADASADAPADAPADSTHSCLCIGDCSGAQVAPLSTPPELQATVVAVPTGTRPRTRRVAPPARVDLELPFATAPPTLG